MSCVQIKDLPPEMRPYEKMEAYGAKSLSDSELLAIILKTGTKEKSSIELAGEVLMQKGKNTCYEHGGLRNLMECDPRDFRSIKGIGKVKSYQLASLAELSTRIWRLSKNEQLKITDIRSVVDYYRQDMIYLKHEEAYIMLVNSKGVFLHSEKVAIGSTDSAVMSIREIIRKAVSFGASGIILVHNHPSGMTEPSRDDIMLSKKLKEASELLNLKLVDSLIIGDGSYTSLSEKGIL